MECESPNDQSITSSQICQAYSQPKPVMENSCELQVSDIANSSEVEQNSENHFSRSPALVDPPNMQTGCENQNPESNIAFEKCHESKAANEQKSVTEKDSCQELSSSIPVQIVETDVSSTLNRSEDTNNSMDEPACHSVPNAIETSVPEKMKIEAYGDDKNLGASLVVEEGKVSIVSNDVTSAFGSVPFPSEDTGSSKNNKDIQRGMNDSTEVANEKSSLAQELQVTKNGISIITSSSECKLQTDGSSTSNNKLPQEEVAEPHETVPVLPAETVYEQPSEKTSTPPGVDDCSILKSDDWLEVKEKDEKVFIEPNSHVVEKEQGSSPSNEREQRNGTVQKEDVLTCSSIQCAAPEVLPVNEEIQCSSFSSTTSANEHVSLQNDNYTQNNPIINGTTVTLRGQNEVFINNSKNELQIDSLQAEPEHQASTALDTSQNPGNVVNDTKIGAALVIKNQDESGTNFASSITSDIYKNASDDGMLVLEGANETSEASKNERCLESEDSTIQESTDLHSEDANCPPHAPKLDLKPTRSLLKRRSPSGETDDGSTPSKKKRSITFDGVTVFYFPRAQGFTCVPSQGGSTLGMSLQHTHEKRFTLQEHATEQRRIHKQMLIKMRRQQRQQLHEQRKSQNPVSQQEDATTTCGEDGNAGGTTDSPRSEESNSCDDESDSDLENELDNYYFLQPVPTRQRRVLLRESGVRKIDSCEKDNCRDIRSSREFCGCSCKTYCDPDSCSCAQAGIKCQVDRLSFPCGCTRDNCANQNGRVEFNPMRVRTHFIHTLMRLELEKKQSEQNGNMQLAGTMMLPPVTQLTHRHGSPMQAGTLNNLGALSTMNNLYGIAQASLQHQLKPVCPLQQQRPIQQPWHNPAVDQMQQLPRPYFKQEVTVTPSSNGTAQQQLYKYNMESFSSTMEMGPCASSANYSNMRYDSSSAEISSETRPTPTQVTYPTSHDASQRDESIDLYSSFRDDSYAESTEEYRNANNSGVSTIHREISYQQNGHMNGVHEASNNRSGTAENVRPYSSAAPDSYYSHSPRSNLHQQSALSYHHQHMLAQNHTISHSQHMYQQVNLQVYSNHTEENQVSYSHNPNSIHHQYRHIAQPAYAKSSEYTNGYSISVTTPPPSCVYSNGLQSHIDQQHLSVPVSAVQMLNGQNDSHLQSHQSTIPMDAEPACAESLHNGNNDLHLVDDDVGSATAEAATSYADLNNVTSFAKLEPFSELLQGTTIRTNGVCKDGIEEVHQDDQQPHNEGENSNEEKHEGESENFGEIIKKTMVETVSA